MTHRPHKDDTLEFPAIDLRPTRLDRCYAIALVLLVIVFASMTRVEVSYGKSLKHCAVPKTITAKHHRTTKQQRINTTRALRVSTRMGATRKQQIALVAAATQEQKLENRPHGHGTSVGFLQLIDLHGSVRWRMNIKNSSRWFLKRAKLFDRPSMTVAQLSQQVQQSGYPTAYAQWVPEARRTTLGYRASCR